MSVTPALLQPGTQASSPRTPSRLRGAAQACPVATWLQLANRHDRRPLSSMSNPSSCPHPDRLSTTSGTDPTALASRPASALNEPDKGQIIPSKRRVPDPYLFYA